AVLAKLLPFDTYSPLTQALARALAPDRWKDDDTVPFEARHPAALRLGYVASVSFCVLLARAGYRLPRGTLGWANAEWLASLRKNIAAQRAAGVDIGAIDPRRLRVRDGWTLLREPSGRWVDVEWDGTPPTRY